MSKSYILCDADIKHLASRLNENSAKILYCLYENESAMEQNKIIKIIRINQDDNS